MLQTYSEVFYSLLVEDNFRKLLVGLDFLMLQLATSQLVSDNRNFDVPDIVLGGLLIVDGG